MSSTHELTIIPGLINFLKTGEIDELFKKYYFEHKYSTKANENYSIIRYDKDYLSSLQNNIERYLLIAKKIPFLKYEECVSEFNRSLDSDVDINKNIWRLFNLCRWLELNPKIKITNK